MRGQITPRDRAGCRQGPSMGNDIVPSGAELSSERPPFIWPVIGLGERLAIYLIDVRRTEILDVLRAQLPLSVQRVFEQARSSDGKWLLAAITLKMAHFTMLL